MGELWHRIWNLIPEKLVSVDWLSGLLVLIGVYALGYLFGLVPFLLTRGKRRLQEESAATCQEIVKRLCEYDSLYEHYVREPDPFERIQLGRKLAAVKEDLKQRESRLAELEQREPRTLPVRALPVRRLEID